MCPRLRGSRLRRHGGQRLRGDSAGEHGSAEPVGHRQGREGADRQQGNLDGDGPITYAYQWQQSSDGGSSWSDIAGATSTSYTPPAGFAGKQVRANVTATNSAGSAQASSPASAVILSGPPVNTVAPSLSGTAQDGKALTVNKGTWTGVATIAYTYQWQRFHRRRLDVERHRRRDDHELHAAGRFRGETGPRERHRHQRRRNEPSLVTRKRCHPRSPPGEHRRALPLGHRERRQGDDRGERNVDGRRDDHLRVSVAGLDRRRHDVE